MIFMGILLTVISIALIYGFIKAVNACLNPFINRLDAKRSVLLKKDNPYIENHKLKMKNDQQYEAYILWLDSVGGDVPFEKWKTSEELRSEQQINFAANKN
jgi:hypothetical protein